MKITVQSLRKSYGRQKVLKGIDVEFQAGTVYGIVGKNGAGKTTFFRCLAGLETYRGQIVYSCGKLKNVTGFLPVTPFMLSKITGREYLQLLLNARNKKVTNWKNANLFDLPLNKYAENYSTGMKKKLALTGILLQKNNVFLLDEPFNGVDVQSNLIIREIIFKLKQAGKIVILSSHIFAALKNVCDILHYLEDGKFIRSATKENFTLIEERMYVPLKKIDSVIL